MTKPTPARIIEGFLSLTTSFHYLGISKSLVFLFSLFFPSSSHGSWAERHV